MLGPVLVSQVQERHEHTSEGLVESYGDEQTRAHDIQGERVWESWKCSVSRRDGLVRVCPFVQIPCEGVKKESSCHMLSLIQSYRHKSKYKELYLKNNGKKYCKGNQTLR